MKKTLLEKTHLYTGTKRVSWQLAWVHSKTLAPTLKTAQPHLRVSEPEMFHFIIDEKFIIKDTLTDCKVMTMRLYFPFGIFDWAEQMPKIFCTSQQRSCLLWGIKWEYSAIITQGENYTANLWFLVIHRHTSFQDIKEWHVTKPPVTSKNKTPCNTSWRYASYRIQMLSEQIWWGNIFGVQLVYYYYYYNILGLSKLMR